MEGIMALELPADDWRKGIVDYLEDPSKKVSRRIRFQATKYVLLEGELYYRTIDGVLLRCLDKEKAMADGETIVPMGLFVAQSQEDESVTVHRYGFYPWI